MTTTAVTTTAMTTTAVTSNLLSATRNPIPAIPIDDAFRPPISFGCIWRLNRKTKTPNWTLMNTNIDETVGHARAKHRSCLLFCGGVFFALVLALFSAAPAQAATFALGTTSLLVGPTAGTNSVVLAATPATATWTASTNATWLHLSAANQSGTGSTNVIFGWDPNPGPTRTGSLTVAGRTLTITQAGSTYVQAPGPVTALADSLSGGGAIGLAVDGTGNVYVAESSHYYIDKWIAVSNTTIALVSASYGPYGVAVDGAGNVYMANDGAGAIKKWTVGNSNVTTLVSGLGFAFGLTVDGGGNLYFSDYTANVIKKWTAANSNVTTLVSSGLSKPAGVAVDAAGNVYFADSGNNAIKKWTAANSNVTTIVSSGLSAPWGLTVDGGGNLYIGDGGNNAIKKWTAANSNVTTLASTGLNGGPSGVAVDGGGNVYFDEPNNSFLNELPYAFVDPTPKSETAAGGSDVLPVVLPTTVNLLPPFVPTSSQPWLTIAGVSNGVVSFSFTANTTTSNRTAQITLLGQAISVTQNFSCPAITVAPGTLPTGTAGSSYNQTITASGGSAPYTFSVTGGTLPAGLTLASSGSLSGTPTTPGGGELHG
jgi:sugar lactone lactonase YvrE